ncbi:MAG TPA: hypothetical protein VK633_05280, partial [Verrucomicrobiae bacterium]|nr:hypothetical protein [Verrucomicrobiae bacterium]
MKRPDRAEPAAGVDASPSLDSILLVAHTPAFLRLGRTFSFLLLALGLLPPAQAAGLLDHWQVRNPRPVAVALADVLYSRGLFFAVGEGGTILTSPNGTNWNSLDTPSDGSLWSLCEGPDALYAVGDAPATLFPRNQPTILRSTDGLSWKSVAAPEGSLGYRKLLYAQGIFVAAGLYGQISTSTDGLLWRNRPSFTFANILGLAWGNGIFVAGTSTGETLASTNGTDWAVQKISDAARIGSVVFAQGSFLATVTGTFGGLSKLITSNDGLVWTDRNPGFPNGSGYRVSFAHGLYFALGYLPDENQGIINISTNGLDWTSTPLEHAAGYNAVAFGAGRYLLAGSPGNLLISSDPSQASSWQSVVTRDFTESFTGITYGAGTFVAVGAAGTIARSPSGEVWDHPTPPRPANFAGVAYGNGKFVAAGNSPGLIAHSADGSTWTEAPFSPSSSLSTVFFGGNLFLIGGENGTILSSSDGESWQSLSVVAGEVITEFAFGNGLYLCVSSGGVVRLSTNGVSWRKTAELDSTTCSFGAGLFIAAGSHAAYHTSRDGVTWQSHSRGDYYWRPRVTYLRDTFLLFGSSGSGLYSSPDAQNWSRRFPRAGNFPQAIAWSPDTFVMVAGASILQSGLPFTFSASQLSPAGFKFQLSASDSNAQLEHSADLKTWLP